jgi:hypothetical protein
MARIHPRTEWVDSGKRIGNPKEKCPNCGSSNYSQTMSTEKCPDCGLECDYWGQGANSVYNSFLARRDAQEAQDLRDKKDRESLQEALERGTPWICRG